MRRPGIHASGIELTVTLDITLFDLAQKLRNCDIQPDRETMIGVINHVREAAQLAASSAIQHEIDRIRAEREQKS